jgi:hypothetical protein
MCNVNLNLTKYKNVIVHCTINTSVLWSLSRGSEIKLPPGAGAEIRIAAPASFFLS